MKRIKPYCLRRRSVACLEEREGDDVGTPENISLTQSEKDWWATLLVTGMVPQITQPGPDGQNMTGFHLTPAQHAPLLQTIMIMAEIPWNPKSGQPSPDQDYSNYQVGKGGEITITDLNLAGQPVVEDEEGFGVEDSPPVSGGIKLIGGIDEDVPEEDQ